MKNIIKTILIFMTANFISISSVLADTPVIPYDPNHTYNTLLFSIPGSTPMGNGAKDGYLTDKKGLIIDQINPMNIAAKATTSNKIPFKITRSDKLWSIDNFSQDKIKVTISVDAINTDTKTPVSDVLTVEYADSADKPATKIDIHPAGLSGVQSVAIIVNPGFPLQLYVSPVKSGDLTGSYTIEKVSK